MDSKGQTTVEFALTAAILLSLLIVLVDLSVMLYVNLTMQHAVRQATRSAVTREGGGDPREVLLREIQENSNGLYEKNALKKTEPVVMVVTPSATEPPAEAIVADTGEPGELITVSLRYSWPLLTPLLGSFFPGGAYEFTACATMKNEP